MAVFCSALWSGFSPPLTRADLKAYFDSIPHTHLRSFLDLRIKDGVVRRMIDKWLKAGVLEEDAVHRPVAGTPQGGVISPILVDRIGEPFFRLFWSSVRVARHGALPGPDVC